MSGVFHTFGIPKVNGSCEFAKSTTYFADNNLGDGGIIELHQKIGGYENKFLARIKWHDWNCFSYEQLGFWVHLEALSPMSDREIVEGHSA